MRAEIVTTGTELLLGQIDDTNATYLARQLRQLGIDVFFRSTVGDNEGRIAEVVQQALDRADLVITTGGLGPTVDDVTREGVARATGRPLVLHPELVEQIAAFFARMGATMTDNNRRQACLPEGCIPIENPVGTAPGFIVEPDPPRGREGAPRGMVVTLPGVPRELYYLMEHVVVPYLLRRLGRQDHIVTRVLRTVGIGESRIDQAIADLEALSNPTVGLAAHPGQTDVRIVAKAPSEAEAAAMVAEVEATVRERLGAAIYATGEATLEETVAGLLRERGAKLAVAETVTQGEIARRCAGQADAFVGGLVAFDGAGLAPLLGLDPAEAVGEAGAAALAQRVGQAWLGHASPREEGGAVLGLAVVGDDPGGPWVAIADEGKTGVRRFRYSGRDYRARTWTTVLSLEFVRRWLLGLAEGWAQ